MQYIKFLCLSPWLPSLCITTCTTVRKSFDILLVFEFLIYSKKYFLIQKNKNYSSICNSIIITSPTGFNIALTKVDARLKQRSINVVPTFSYVVSTLCNVVSTSGTDVYRRCAKLKIRRRICLIFKVRSTLFQRWSTTLKQRWSDVEMLAGLKTLVFQVIRDFKAFSI